MASVPGDVQSSSTEKKDESLFNYPVPDLHTEEFDKIAQQCKVESFWYRALPLSLASMLILKVMDAKGIMKSHFALGSPNVIAFFGALGFFIGKVSYGKTCQKKYASVVLPYGSEPKS